MQLASLFRRQLLQCAAVLLFQLLLFLLFLICPFYLGGGSSVLIGTTHTGVAYLRRTWPDPLPGVLPRVLDPGTSAPGLFARDEATPEQHRARILPGVGHRSAARGAPDPPRGGAAL